MAEPRLENLSDRCPKLLNLHLIMNCLHCHLHISGNDNNSASFAFTKKFPLQRIIFFCSQILLITIKTVACQQSNKAYGSGLKKKKKKRLLEFTRVGKKYCEYSEQLVTFSLSHSSTLPFHYSQWAFYREICLIIVKFRY